MKKYHQEPQVEPENKIRNISVRLPRLGSYGLLKTERGPFTVLRKTMDIEYICKLFDSIKS